MKDYFLKYYSRRKVETFSYVYDEFKDSMASDKKYLVDIIFVDEEFDSVVFREKDFMEHLNSVKMVLLDKINKEIDRLKSISVKMP
jgi:hypothetical protein